MRLAVFFILNGSGTVTRRCLIRRFGLAFESNASLTYAYTRTSERRAPGWRRPD